MLHVHSTRLLPMKQGADQYKITGIAAKCDWVVLSDTRPPHIHFHKNIETETPETVFLSLRCHTLALRHFAEVTLPLLTRPIILISGSSDATLPNQIDKRWSPLNDEGRQYVQSILEHPCLRYWVMENPDDISHPLIRPLPLGMVFSDTPEIRDVIDVPLCSKLASRPLRVLCGHRVRDGAQWDTRKQITQTARTHWSEFTTILEDDIPEPDFLDKVRAHTFVLCAEGGGQDPSPKAWQALLHGAIPIVRKNALHEVYEHFPVVFVKDWSANALTLPKLTAWRDILTQEYDDPIYREDVIQKLDIQYWWDWINSDPS